MPEFIGSPEGRGNESSAGHCGVALAGGLGVETVVMTTTSSSDRAAPSTAAGAPAGAAASASGDTHGSGQLAPELALRVHELMLMGRVLEERLITMYRQGDGYFWIGGPGEEAFNVPLGLLVNKGEGIDHDYLHLHYRSSGTLLAMGADPVDSLRLMKNTATDPYSRGRNFCGHYSVSKWNIAPITSPIEVQYSIAPGTAMAQRRRKGKGITIVTGGDAGSAEGDFATCLVWSSRKGNELPLLILVTNNQYGISTAWEGQHGETRVSDRGKAFGMPTATIDGNDPEASWFALKKAMDYVRTERKPYLLEAMVSRLNGHSSASGANFVKDENDCLTLWERKLEERKLRTRTEMDEMRAKMTQDLLEAAKRVREEPQPRGDSIWEHVFAERKEG
jgi:2-oxoisovalerate dehydrogenase E1 component alpha subunit